MNAPIDLAALKGRQQMAWASGDYAVIGTTLQIVGESLAEACDLNWDEDVLDVAAGNGNATLAAARRGCRVTSTDYVSTLLERGAERARADRFDVKFEVADAEALPYEDASFDAVLSTFGVMFAPDQGRAAEEMARVCRPGGRIGMANWTPSGFIGQLFKTLGRHMPPPAGVQPPSLWGVESHLRTLFGTKASSIVVTPTDKATALERDLADLLASMNKGRAHSLVVPSEYVEIVVTRR
jgi:SAM-dependent methyltransferase